MTKLLRDEGKQEDAKVHADLRFVHFSVILAFMKKFTLKIITEEGAKGVCIVETGLSTSWQLLTLDGY